MTDNQEDKICPIINIMLTLIYCDKRGNQSIK